MEVVTGTNTVYRLTLRQKLRMMVTTTCMNTTTLKLEVWMLQSSEGVMS
jgi:hypothetical protein